MNTINKTRERSALLFKAARELMPGGVNSPVRAFKSIGSDPVFIKRAKGAYLWDEDGNRYIDYVGSWGPMILGHADSDIEAAIVEAARSGTSFGAPTALESEMAREVIKLVPSIEMVRMVNSGTEAVMAALRLARAYVNSSTGREALGIALDAPERNIIIKFSGCYHGHADSMLVAAGSGASTLGLPDSPGVTRSASQDTLILPFNDEAALTEAFAQHGEHIAAIITEPVIGNSGCIPPQAGFLKFLREITKLNGSLLIFDEVMTGFRVALGGAQELYDISPDITTLGKIIGGGLPVGAYGASREIMSMVAPAGPMYQAGTLSGNPLAMSAGLTCLRKIQKPAFYDELTAKTRYLVEGLRSANQESDIPEIHNAQLAAVGAMFGQAFTEQAVHNYEDAKTQNLDLFRKYYLAMLERGIYFAPSAFEAGFISAAHSYEDLDVTIAAHRAVIKFLHQ